MSNKEKIEKTKTNLNIKELNSKERNDLFDRFVKGGGKVIDERPKVRSLTIDRNKQRQLLKTTTEGRKGRGYDIPAGEATKGDVKKQKPRVKISIQTISPFDKIKLRFRLFFGGITDLSILFFNPRFFGKFNRIYKTSLMQLQVLYFELIKQNIALGNKIVSRIDAVKPLYNELIEMTGELYDSVLISQLIQHYETYPEVPQKVSELKIPMTQLYKKIHVLYRFENAIYNAFLNAIECHSKFDDKGNTSYSTMKRQLRNCLFAVFHNLYPRLHLVMCGYYSVYMECGDMAIESLIGVDDGDKPGRRYLKKIQERESLESNEEIQEPEEEIEPDDAKTTAIKKGLELMTKIDFKELRKNLVQSSHFINLSDTDKVLMAYLLFYELDKEYSFIMTTNKIKFNVDLSDRINTDFKSKLNDLYGQMQKCFDAMQSYADEYIIYDKGRKEKPLSNDQYIEYTKRIEILYKKKNQVGKAALEGVHEFLMKFATIMKTLIDDMNSMQKYIENPQDNLEFEIHIEGNKKLHGKKIYEAINIIYAYTVAFISRLDGGDLSGKLTPESEVEPEQIIQKEPSKDVSEKPKKPKAIIDELSEELDDML